MSRPHQNPFEDVHDWSCFGCGCITLFSFKDTSHTAVIINVLEQGRKLF